MRSTFLYDRRTAWLPGSAGAALAVALTTASLVTTGEKQAALAVLAALAAVGLSGVLPLVFDPRVQLSVTAQGLFYRPFSPNPVPWSEITAIAVVRTHHRLGRLASVLWRKTLTRETVNFEVLEPNHWAQGLPLYRLGARLKRANSVPIYPIELAFLRNADTPTVVREIKRYWKGHIALLEVRERE